MDIVNIDITTLPDDALYEIVLNLSPKKILDLCQLNKRFYQKICQSKNPLFWRQLYMKWISAVRVPQNPKMAFFRIMKQKMKIKSERDLVEYLAENGYEQALYSLKNLDLKNYQYYGFYKAIKGGHLDIVQEMIKRGVNDWGGGLYHAALGGHKDIVQYLIQKGADNWNSALYGAALGGHLSIIQDMIQRGVVQRTIQDILNNMSIRENVKDYIKSIYYK